MRLEEFVLVGDFLQEDFVLNYLRFLKWEINLPNGAEKLPIDGIDGDLEKEELPPTPSEFF